MAAGSLILSRHALQRWDERVVRNHPAGRCPCVYAAASRAVDVTHLSPYLPLGRTRPRSGPATLLWDEQERVIFLTVHTTVLTVWKVTRPGILHLLTGAPCAPERTST